ncbi:AAA family ATPase [Streptomyces sp. NBC_01803]|nr:AAA family ATPase [Streptomyces sp. NBC_01803]
MLIEREDQLAILRTYFDESHDDRGRGVVVSGPAASGKTELLFAFAQEAAAFGAIVLNASALPSERNLPFGVLNQLLRSSRPNAAAAERVRRAMVLPDEADTADLGGEGAGGVPAQILYRVTMALLELVEQAGRPLVVIVDDAHFADLPSAMALHTLVERLRVRHAFLLALGESTHYSHAAPLFQGEPLPKPHCERIRLGMLSPEGTATLLARQMSARGAAERAAEYHALTGGNPLLLRGLMADSRTTTPGEVPPPVVGHNFSQALLDCVHRSPSPVISVARALAVLGESAEPVLVGQLADERPEVVSFAVTALREIGLVEDSWFRAPDAARIILNGMQPEARGATRTRAARLLYAEGEPSRIVARQLLGADVSDVENCAVAVLQDAADQSIAEGDIGPALRFLRMAQQIGGDEQVRAKTAAMLARAEWWFDPSAALRRACAMGDPDDDSGMPVTEVVVPLVPLMWFGELERADATLRRLERALPDMAPDLACNVHAFRLWRRYLYPGAQPDGPTAAELSADLLTDQVGDSARTMHPLRAVVLMTEALRRGAGQESVERAERILQEHRLNERTLSFLATAIIALIRHDRLASAARWCEGLVEESEAMGVPTWQAVYSALYAEIALRRSDLPTAERFALRALTLLEAKSWGVAVGLPLGTLLEANAAMGNLEEAVKHLRTPVPDAMFQTPFGLRYLLACGRYHHANGQFHAALEDFSAIARLTDDWGLELPVLFPWRIEAAHASLKLGRSREARELAEAQLRLSGVESYRSRAAALRVLAVQRAPEDRLTPLREVVTMLRGSEDRLEYAAALTDLGMTLYALGRDGEAQAELRRAHRVTRQCGAEEPPRTLVHHPGKSGSPLLSRETVRETQLSEAELRVAVLAAQGMSNRQISGSLHITVSTVEQHLTRVYRKLEVSRRTDLPLAMDMNCLMT